ncbi:MAG: acyltransferase family protein [Kangiellaceae bacterium]
MVLLTTFSKYFHPNSQHAPSRRYDLDWLRVLAFGLLIFYHTGMLYVQNWGFHLKSQYLSENLEVIMLLVNPWRMPILWLISGIAIRFVLAKVSVLHFIKWRSYRLLLPLLFGVLVIVPPQLYYEMTFNGDLKLSYWQFYQLFFDLQNPVFESYQPGIWPHIDVNHLWYLRELWSFSLYLLVILPLLNSRTVELIVNWIAIQHGVLILLILTLPILAIQFSMEETRKALGFLFLIYGYLLGWHQELWHKLKINSINLLVVGIICYLIIAVFYKTIWLNQSEQANQTLLIIGSVFHGFDRLVWGAAVLGLGYRFLNKPSVALSYLNGAVYPFYILHQTIIIAAAYELSKFQLGAVFEPLLVLVITFSGCNLAYEIIRRTDFLRPFFGAKIRKSYSRITLFVASWSATILVFVIALEILL